MSDTNKLREIASLVKELGTRVGPENFMLLCDEIDRQAALIAKYEAALKQYADHTNWAKTDYFSRHVDWWQPDTHGWTLAENALKGANEQ